MATPSVPAVRALDAKGVGRLGIAAGTGFAGALAAIVVPLIFLYLVVNDHGGFFRIGANFVEVTAVLVLLGAILLFLSLFFYRRSFAALRKVDSRFYVASVLCIIGSLGFLLLLVAAAVVVGDTNNLVACAGGRPTHAFSCLESGQPLGAWTGLLGFLLGWIGGIGVVLGLFLSGSRFRSGLFTVAAIVYLLLLLFVFVPLAGLFVSVPGVGDLVLLAPILALVGPGLALGGALSSQRRMAPA